MFKLIVIPFLFLFANLYAATCSTTSRTNYSTGQVLTSSSLNTDFNQLVTKANAMDGGCISDSSIESTAFDSSLDALKNGIHQGCLVTYSDSNTVIVDKCILSVGGKFVKTTASASVSWLCDGCSSEASSTQYYVYAKTTSTATALSLLISNNENNADGLDNSGNKVLGKFYNNSSNNIDSALVYSWSTNSFVQSASGTNYETFSFTYGTPSTASVCTTGACSVNQTGSSVTSLTNIGTGLYTLQLYRTFTKIFCFPHANNANINTVPVWAYNMEDYNVSTLSLKTIQMTSGLVDSFGTVFCQGY